jgi:hypothetical protein
MALVRRVREPPKILLRADDLIVDVLERADVDVTVGELLDEDRRQPDDDAIRNPRVPQIVQQHEERKVRAEHGLVDPLLAVRPAPRTAAIGQMRVQRENECPHRYVLSPKAPLLANEPPRRPVPRGSVL